MNNFRKYLGIAEKRKTIEQIEIAMSVFINLFEESDKKKIVNVLYKLYICSDYFSGISMGILCIGMSFFINSSVYLLSSYTVLFLAIYILKIDKDKLAEIKNQFMVLSRNCKSKYYTFYISNILYYVKDVILLKGILWYVLGLIFAGFIHKREAGFFIFAVFAALFLSCILFAIYLVVSYNLPIRTILDKPRLVCCFLCRENIVKIKKYEKHIGFELLIKRLFYKKYTDITVKIISVLMSFVILVIWLILWLNNKDINIMNIVVLSVLPMFPGAILTGLIYDGLFQKDFILTTYYYNKKFNILSDFNRLLFKETMLSISYLILPLFLFTFINLSNVYIIIGAFFNMIHCIVIAYLVSGRISKFTKFSYDKLNSNVISTMTSNTFEDFVVVGLPIIMVSGTIVSYVKNGDLSNIIAVYGIFIFSVLIYTFAKTVINKMTSKSIRKRG